MGVWVCPRVSVHAWVCHWVLGKVLRVRAVYEALGILGAMSVWLCMCLCVCLWVLAGKREVSDRCLELAIWKPPPVGFPPRLLRHAFSPPGREPFKDFQANHPSRGMTVTWLIWGLKNMNNRSSQSLHLSCLEQGMGTDAPGLAISLSHYPC